MGNLEEQRKRAKNYGERADKALAREDWAEVKALSLKEFDILKPLAKETKSARDYKNLALSYRRLGDCARKEEDNQVASKYYDEAIKVDIELVKMESTKNNLTQLALDYFLCGDIQKRLGEKENARSCYEYALAVLDALDKKDMRLADYEIIAKCNFALSQFAKEDSNWDLEKEYAKNELVAREAVFKLDGTKKNMGFLAAAIYRIAIIEKGDGNIELAETHYRRAIELYENLMHQSDEAKYWVAGALAYRNLGVLRTEPDYDALKKSYRILTQLIKRFPENKNYGYLRDGLERLVDQDKSFWKSAENDEKEDLQIIKTSDLHVKTQRSSLTQGKKENSKTVKTSDLHVKTRGNSSPQGKARVYLCCHPDDLENCLEVLGAEIFETQNCAIYYGVPDETELAEMRLFIVALTTRFLTKECRARSFEYGFAVEHRIPVLPIAMEPEMDKLFPEIMNRVKPGYGDVQFLNRASEDLTEIPYVEKLKKQLENILVGDELAERVRAAFDAYIFLSYRKKDRAEARDLMELIHRIPFCRDIAIWYDEYLVPGEGWSDAIAGAMAKSALVVLAVTPNLTEPGNYIINHEYPDAKRAKKEIVPTELLPTNIKKLKELFPELPDIVNCHNPKALAKALGPSLQALAIKENETPEHDYLIGLAYLGGIDVERDTDAAVRLITSAAERKLPEAIKKLADMYQTGDGVERDYEVAAKWLEKLVEMRRQAYKASRLGKDGWELFKACWDSGNAWYAMGRISRAKTVYQEMLAVARKLEESFMPDTYKRILGISYDNLGNIAKSEGNFAAAKEWYEKALELRELAKETWTENLGRELFASYNNLGDIAKLEGNLATAKEWYEKCLELSKVFAEEAGTVESRRILSVIYNNLGNIAEMGGNLTVAKEWYEKCLELCKELAEETCTVESRRNLSVSYDRLGNLAILERNLTSAKGWNEKSLELRKELAEETGTVESRRDLNVSYCKLGVIAEMEGDLTVAKRWYEKCLDLSKELAEETGTVESRRDLGVSYCRLGDLAKSEGDLAAAKRWYEKHLRVSKELAEETRTVESRRDLSASYANLGEIAYVERDFAVAKEYYEKSQKLSKELAEETGIVEVRRILMLSCNRLGDIAKSESDLVTAKAWFEKGMESSKELAEETGTVESRRDLSISYGKLGSLAEARGDLAMAKSWYAKELELSKGLEDGTGTVESRRDLSLSYIELGDIAESEGDLATAKGWYEKGLELSKEIAEETGTVEARSDLGLGYNRLGDTARVEGDLATAKGCYEKALELYKALAEETGTIQAWCDLYYTCNVLGVVFEKEGNFIAAKQCYENAVSIAQAVVQATNIQEFRDDLAGFQRNLENLERKNVARKNTESDSKPKKRSPLDRLFRRGKK